MIRNFVLIAVQQDGGALEYTSDELKDDKDEVLIVVQQYGYNFKVFFRELKNAIKIFQICKDIKPLRRLLKKKVRCFYFLVRIIKIVKQEFKLPTTKKFFLLLNT